MKNIAIIPARSGSKGLKDKNIRPLNDKPLIAYSIETAIKTGIFDEIMVSTDSEVYATIAIESGASVPFLRSFTQSSDTAGSWDVVKEVLNGYRLLKREFDTVCLLQPTSPLRRVDDIISAYKLMECKSADSITSVCEMDHSPLWAMVLPKDGSLTDFRKNLNDAPRQQLSTYYRINGAIYIRKVEYGNDYITIKDENEFAYIMDRRNSVDIDTLEDFEIAEFYIKNHVID
jgi:CMP-N,N'-diacetyllegionaminic acid synthase